MMFDDHDVTDDWNLTAEWRQRVWGSDTGRRVVANALAAYWAFQGWGNSPDEFDDEFKEVVAGALQEKVGSASEMGARYDDLMWSFDRWSFVAPLDPVVVFLDTRTQRSYDSPNEAARLVGEREGERVIGLVKEAGYRPEGPLVLVSPVPIFGLELQERRQKFLVDKVGPYEIDFEAWHSNLRGFVDFMALLIDDLALERCLLLSGDVHYGLNVAASFSIGVKKIEFIQLVSSSFKHSGALSRLAIDALGRAVTKQHERIGWEKPPQVDAAPIKKSLVYRAANNDEWSEESLVFLAPGRARSLGISEEPDYRETRRYLRPKSGRAVLVGENNVGLVTLENGSIRHRLLSRDRDETKTHTVTVSFRG